MRKLFLVLGLFCLFGVSIKAQVAVQPVPFVKSQWFDNNGRPVSGGCIFTYQSGTTTPLTTYSDAAGTVLNSNPVRLDAAGRGNIFLTAAAYTLVLKTSGGTNCSLGVQIWSIDGINPSANSILSSNNVWTGNNTWQATSTFNGPVFLNVGFTSTGPNILGGGGSMSGTYSGSPIFSGTPNFSGGFTGTNATLSGQLTMSIATGTPPFIISSTTNVPNLNASSINGCTFPIPCPLGSTTPNTVHSTTETIDTGLVFNGSALSGTGVIGNSNKMQSAGTMSGVAGAAICDDGSKNTTTSGCNAGFSQIEAVRKISATCTPSTSNSFDACTDTLTWPTPFADTSYAITCSGVNPEAESLGSSNNKAPIIVIASYTVSHVVVITQQERNIQSNFDEIHCIGIHP